MDRHGLSTGKFGVSGLESGNGMDMLFTAIEREQSGKGLNISAPEATHPKEVNNNSNVQAQSVVDNKALDQARPSIAGPYPGLINGFPLGAYAQAPLLVPYLAPQIPGQNRFRQPAPHATGMMLPGMPSSVSDVYDLRCAACGLHCKTMPDLHEHIMRKHIQAGADYGRLQTTLSPETEAKERRASLASVIDYREASNVKKTPPPRKYSSELHPSISYASDRKSSVDFPIPTPNFALLSSYSSAPAHNAPVVSNQDRIHDAPKLFADGQLPPFALGSHMKSLPYSHLPAAYSMLNPFLAYQNFMNVNGIYAAGSVPTSVPSGISLGAAAAAGYPCMRYPNAPGAGYIPGRFPYIPGMPMMLAPSSVPPEPTGNNAESILVKEAPSRENVPSANFDATINRQSDKTDEIADLTRNFASSRQADSLRRRLSVPLIGLNKDFRVPHPYRVGKSNGNSGIPGATAMDRNGVDADQSQQSRQSLINRKRKSLVEKPSHSRLNVKSIEQHISKLISNNEKVLLNPVLERVKPRRVFRRNSLDPASLSSYAAAIAGRNPIEGQQYKEDETLKQASSKLYTDAHNRFRIPPCLGTSIPSTDLPKYPPGMTSSDYDRMIQLTRVPHVSTKQPHMNDLNEQAMAVSKMYNNKDSSTDNEGILGKRDMSCAMLAVSSKKAKRSTFFECSDCGVRYRKEENYKIHKQMYCKYKNQTSVASTQGGYSTTLSVENAGHTKQSRRHSDLPPPSVKHNIFPHYACDDATFPKRNFQDPASSNSGGVYNIENTLLGKYTKIVPPILQSNLAVNPMKFLHNELFRTKSADAALQTAAELQDSKDPRPNSVANPKSSNDKELNEVTNAVNTTSTATCTQPQVTNAASVGPACSIPTNKLPPNKRHLMRQLEQGSSGSESVQQDTTEHSTVCSSTNPVSTAGLDTSKNTLTNTNSLSEQCQIPSSEETPALSLPRSEYLQFDETSVPRSNYKLLLHQISLRNMQDMGLINNLQAELPQDKSVWSWQQIQKGLQNRSNSEKIPHNSVDNPKHEIPRSHRKFSVPSRLCQVPDTNNHSMLQKSRSSSHKNIPPFRTKHDLAVTEQTSVSHKEQSLHVVSSGTSNENSCSSNVNEWKRVVMASSASDHLDFATLPESVVGGTPPKSSRPPASAGTIATTSSKDPQEFVESNNSGKVVNTSPTQLKCTDEAGKSSTNNNIANVDANQVVQMSMILYPHLQPTLTAQSHVSYCCMVSPQPTCMDIPKTSDASATQLSMYSDWAVSEPILPPDLTISDILTGWRRSRHGYRKGIDVIVKSNVELIVTDKKSYENQKKKQLEKNGAKNSNSETDPVDETLRDKAAVLNHFEENGLIVPVLCPSALAKSVSKPIYACCHYAQGTRNKTSASFTPTTTTPSNGTSRPPSTSGTTHTCNDKMESSGVTTSPLQGISMSSSSLKTPPSVSNSNIASSNSAKDSLSEGESNAGTKVISKNLPVVQIVSDNDKCSGRLTESDSDALDLKIAHFGRIKRRRTRKERTAASPREKRRALHCKSPPSPSTPLHVPVHQSSMCSSVTEERLRGCALCSIKAGRADLITDTNSACQPCRDAAKMMKMLHQRPSFTNASKSNASQPSPLYTSHPVSTSGYLDKTRASSGNTQHWVSNNTPEATEHCLSQPAVFRYPSPQSGKSSASEGTVDTSSHPVPTSLSSPYFNGNCLSKNDKAPPDVDLSKVSVGGSLPPDLSPAVVSPSLAEVVSEVMRTAAMQSKRHNKSAKRHHLLSHSRALVPGNLPSPLSVDPTEGHKAMETEVASTSHEGKAHSAAKLFSLPCNAGNFIYPSVRSHSTTASSRPGKTTGEHLEPCEITITPATPPHPCSPRPKDTIPATVSTENTSKALAKFGHKSMVITSRESELFLNKANTFQSNHNTAEDAQATNGKANPCYTDSSDNPCVDMTFHIASNAHDLENDASYHDDGSCDSDEEGVKDDMDGSRAADGTARPYRCHECKVAFRIGGHLAKHLRSKGHTVAMQKKTLNRLKMRQIQLCISGTASAPPGVELDNVDVVSEDFPPTVNGAFSSSPLNQIHKQMKVANNSVSEILDGTEGLARSQVRALFEGSGEYACVPNTPCEDIPAGDVGDDMIGSQDPRPFKCIACKVAFRFQGHLDRHFRSNLHLIAVGHYEQDAAMVTMRGSHLSAEESFAIVCNENKGEVDRVNDHDDIMEAERRLSLHVGQNESFSASPRSPLASPRYVVDQQDVPRPGNPCSEDQMCQDSGPYPGHIQPRNGFCFVPKYASWTGRPAVESSSRPDPSRDSSNFVSSKQPTSSAPRLDTNNNYYQQEESDKFTYESVDAKSRIGRQAVTQLRTRTNSQSEDGVPLRSSDCMSRPVALPCQVSCT